MYESSTHMTRNMKFIIIFDNNLNHVDDDVDLMYEMNSDDVDIVEVTTTRTASTTTASNCTVNYNIYDDI